MAEPVTSSYATGSVTALTLVSLLPGIEAAVILGAFAGAMVFVMASEDLTALKKLGFFVISFIAGCMGASLAAGILDGLLPDKVEVSQGVGALVAAALSVRVLLMLIRRVENPGELMDAFRGKEKEKDEWPGPRY
ncbi:MAG: phage holin family protein [Gammaproteobacteria bacterium]|nr:phage holin family protein [Gammaproteobacteria bacterium]